MCGFTTVAFTPRRQHWQTQGCKMGDGLFKERPTSRRITTTVHPTPLQTTVGNVQGRLFISLFTHPTYFQLPTPPYYHNHLSRLLLSLRIRTRQIIPDKFYRRYNFNRANQIKYLTKASRT